MRHSLGRPRETAVNAESRMPDGYVPAATCKYRRWRRSQAY
jgi:hypothetical protein